MNKAFLAQWCALMLVVIAAGVVMFRRRPILGAVQIILGAASFGINLYWLVTK